MPPPTIIAHKSTFLAAQTLRLSQAVAPSAAWRAAHERAGNGDRDGDGNGKGEGNGEGPSARAVDDAVYRLNHALAQHARRVYAPQATRHVAEQIERSFYEAAERAARGGDEDEGEGEGGDEADGDDVERRRQRLGVGADFTTDEAISSLPPSWAEHRPREAAAHPPEARRYAELAASLASLSARRRAARERVARLRRMSALLAPFGPSPPYDDTNNNNNNNNDNKNNDSSNGNENEVQQNLVTRNGEVERELERMRLLLARVAGRVGRLPPGKAGKGLPLLGGDDVDVTDLDSLERGKVDKLLDLF